VSAAPISTIDLRCDEFVPVGPPSYTASRLREEKTIPADPLIDVLSVATAAKGSLYSIEATGWDPAELFSGQFPAIASAIGLFESIDFGLNITDGKHQSPGSMICGDPDSYLRTLGGEDDCVVAGPVGSGVLTLPFLVILGWACVILTVVGFYRLYGNWKVRRWRRREGARGVGADAAKPRGVARGLARRSSPRGKPRYAG
jgi:hypothetical protein